MVYALLISCHSKNLKRTNLHDRLSNDRSENDRCDRLQFYLRDRSNHSDSKNTRMHCVPDNKISKFPLLEDLSNPKSMGSLSFPLSFTSKNTHKYRKKKQPSSRNRLFTAAMLNFTKMARTMLSDAAPLDLYSLSQRSRPSYGNHQSLRSQNYFFQRS